MSTVTFNPLSALIVMPLLGGLLSPLLSILVYRISRRRIQRHETLKSGAYLFYQILSGVLLGKFLFHTQLTFYYTIIFVGIGIYLAYGAEMISRIWNTNPQYIASTTEADDIGVNHEEMIDQSVIVAKNLGSNESANMLWTVQDAAKEQRKRMWLMGSLLVVFSVISIMDGMIPIYRNPQSTTDQVMTIIAYMVNGIAMTAAIYGSFLHAKLHVHEVKRTRILVWTALTLYWSIVLICSAVPVLVGVSQATVKGIAENMTFLAFYGIAAGCVLFMHEYYHIRKADCDKKQIVVGYIVFGLCMGQACVTGIWL